MNNPELISDSQFSSCDSGRAGASDVTAWDAPVMASGGQGDVLAALPAGGQGAVLEVLPAGDRSDVRDGRAACVVVVSQ